MSKSLILFVGVIYMAIAVDQYRKGNVGMAMCFSGYAFSNVGLWLGAS